MRLWKRWYATAKTNYVCHLKDVSYQLPNGKRLFDNINLAFLEGAKIGVIGSNGSGKSTLMKIIAKLEPAIGDIWMKKHLKIGFLHQEPELDPTKTVQENILDGIAEATRLLEQFDQVSMAMSEPNADFDTLLKKQAELQSQIEALDCWDLSHEVNKAMKALRVPPGDADVATLSGGERRRVALCRLLLEKPQMLILDEPTNHLDAESVHWLEQYLASYRGAVISITHDRYFLDNVAQWILEIDQGRLYPHEGNYTSFLKAKQQRMELEEKSEATRAKMLKRELEWIMNHQGQSKGNKSRRQQQNKDQTDAHRASEGQIVIPKGPRLGNKVITVNNVGKKYGNRVLFENVSFEIGPESIVGIIGGNGRGKSTLCDIIAGRLQPDTGAVTHGQTVQLGYVSQNRCELNPKSTVFEEISGHQEYVDYEGQRIHARAYVASFNLRGSSQEKKVGKLSGGERNRVQLAKTLLNENNVLILDEPTNDLDVDTLRSLEMALHRFDGVAIVISHDRWFLNRICTHTLAFEDDGKVTLFKGNYHHYSNVRGHKFKN